MKYALCLIVVLLAPGCVLATAMEDTLFVDADGTTQTWAASGCTNHWECVDDGSSPDDASSYVYCINSVDYTYELFSQGNFSSTGVTGIDSIKLGFYGANSTGHTGQYLFRVTVRQSSTNYGYDTLEFSSGYGWVESRAITVDPATSSAWTASGINSMEHGMQRIAVRVGQQLRASALRVRIWYQYTAPATQNDVIPTVFYGD